MATGTSQEAESPFNKLVSIDLEHAAGLLGVSTKTILRQIHRRELRAFKIGRQWRMRVAEIDAFQRRQEKQAEKY